MSNWIFFRVQWWGEKAKFLFQFLAEKIESRDVDSSLNQSRMGFTVFDSFSPSKRRRYWDDNFQDFLWRQFFRPWKFLSIKRNLKFIYGILLSVWEWIPVMSQDEVCPIKPSQIHQILHLILWYVRYNFTRNVAFCNAIFYESFHFWFPQICFYNNLFKSHISLVWRVAYLRIDYHREYHFQIAQGLSREAFKGV